MANRWEHTLEQRQAQPAGATERPPPPPLQAEPWRLLFLRYGGAILAVAAATLLRLWLDPILQQRAPFSTYYLAIMVVAWYARLGPALVAIFVGVVLANHLFIEPRGTFLLQDLEHQVSGALFLAVGTLIAMLTESLHRRSAMLEQANKQLQNEKRSLKSVMMLQDRERQLIGFEIHDNLVQLLTGAKMHLESLQRLEEVHHHPPAKESLESGIQALSDGIKVARSLINSLKPPSLDATGVVGAIEDLVPEVQDRERREIELVSNVVSSRLPRPLENTILRIVQEGLANACHHSESKRVRIELRQEDGRLRIEVRDWGIGFDPQAVASDHFGVESIRERARVFGGQATIESSPGKGTRIVVRLPLPNDEETRRTSSPCPASSSSTS